MPAFPGRWPSPLQPGSHGRELRAMELMLGSSKRQPGSVTSTPFFAHRAGKCNVQNVSCAPGRWKMRYRAIRSRIWNSTYCFFYFYFFLFLQTLFRKAINGLTDPEPGGLTLNLQTIFIFLFKLHKEKWVTVCFWWVPVGSSSLCMLSQDHVSSWHLFCLCRVLCEMQRW